MVFLEIIHNQKGGLRASFLNFIYGNRIDYEAKNKPATANT
jgi:hypothetical protein